MKALSPWKSLNTLWALVGIMKFGGIVSRKMPIAVQPEMLTYEANV
jgi:hypothetical protein